MSTDTPPTQPRPDPSQVPAPQVPAGHDTQVPDAAARVDHRHLVVEQHVQWFETAMDADCL